MFLDRVYNVTVVSYENIVFLILAEALSQLRHTPTQERLRQVSAQAGPGRPRASGSPQDRLRYARYGAALTLRYVCTAQAAGSRTAQARPGHASVQLRHHTPRQAQTCPGAQEGADTLEGTDTPAAPGTPHAQAGASAQARSGMLNDGSGTLRQVQASSDTLRHAQTRSETSDRLRYVRVLRHARTAR
jgi:hypothetical protein